MTDSFICNSCGHLYIFKAQDNFKGKFEHFIWSCEVLAEVEKCVSAVMKRALLTFSEVEREFLKERG